MKKKNLFLIFDFSMSSSSLLVSCRKNTLLVFYLNSHGLPEVAELQAEGGRVHDCAQYCTKQGKIKFHMVANQNCTECRILNDIVHLFCEGGLILGTTETSGNVSNWSWKHIVL